MEEGFSPSHAVVIEKDIVNSKRNQTFQLFPYQAGRLPAALIIVIEVIIAKAAAAMATSGHLIANGRKATTGAEVTR